jgi:hypothetical protein
VLKTLLNQSPLNRPCDERLRKLAETNLVRADPEKNSKNVTARLRL